MGKAVVEVGSLVKRYDKLKAVDGISFEVKRARYGKKSDPTSCTQKKLLAHRDVSYSVSAQLT